MTKHEVVSVLVGLLCAFTIAGGAAAQSFAPDREKSVCPRVPNSDKERGACEDLIKKYPKDPDLYFNLGNYDFIKKGNRDTAKTWYRIGIEKEPNYYRSHIVSAALAEWEGDIDRAIAALNKAIALNNKDPFAYNNRGNAWNAMGDNDKAIADYNEAIRLDPKFAIAYYNRGRAWRAKGDYDKAIADYNEAIRLDPKYKFAYDNRGNAWYAKGDNDKAIADYNEAIRLDPKYANTYNSRGYAWNAKGDNDKAIADYNEAIKFDTKFVHAYNNRGNAWIAMGDNDKAIADYNEAIRLNPKYKFAFNNRGNAWQRKGDNDKAIADYNEAIRLDPKFANAKENLELALIKQKKQTQQAAAKPQQQPSSPSSSNGKRVALVIGNSKYKLIDALENPSKDAELVAKKLKASGFDDVVVKLNLTRVQMMSALKDFEKIAESADWAEIYFAGHGIEISGVNYLMPVDAELTEETRISTQTINLEYLLNSVEVAKKLRLVILDACRNNPYAKKVAVASASRGVGGGSASASSVGRGLSRLEPQPGTLVVYSAKAGSFALDGDGENSPFAEALAKRIEQKPPIEARRLFDFVRQDVFAGTKKEQTPFSYGSLEPSEDFFFTR